MKPEITLYSFANADRSGKVRWTAFELGYEINEQRLALGDHHKDTYRQTHPFGLIPSVILDGRVLIDSTAICLSLAERHPESALIPEDASGRENFWRWCGLVTMTLEQPVVNYYLSGVGLADERWRDLCGGTLSRQLGAAAEMLPDEGYICGQFTLVDIFAAYVFRLAVQSGLSEYSGTVKNYLTGLQQHPAAIEAEFFAGLEPAAKPG